MKIKLTKKDKSLFLFILSLIVILWGIFSFFSFLVSNFSSNSSNISKIAVNDKNKWFNVSRPLKVGDLEDRVILLDFWTYACVNCIQALPEIKALEKEYGSKLTVIGVHSAKFVNEKDSKAIRKAILKYDINHPVINDDNLKIWNSFKISSWPSFVLINPKGNIIATYVGEEDIPRLKSEVKEVISKFKYQLNRASLPIMLEGANLIGNVLDFPTKLEYSSNFSYQKYKNPALFIANSGANNIIVSSLSGDIIVKIGSKVDGFLDGDFSEASFSAPQGLLYDNGKLYVADKGNHALRLIDFKEEKVTTLIGSSKKGSFIDKKTSAKDVDLASPTDIEFFPDKNHIVIANSGTHQILSYDLKKEEVSVLAGSGVEGIEDGKYPKNSLAQTADMDVFNKKLYFVDSKTSSLRVLDSKGEVETLIGKGLFDFGNKDGSKEEALMQHPLGLLVDDTGAYISDSFNHVIRKYSFSSKKISSLVGSKVRGEDLGSAKSTEFDEPEGIKSILGNFYISDSNNNRIVLVNRGTLKSGVLDIMPPLRLSKEGFLEYLPNLQRAPTINVVNDEEISFKININKGWKINENGPSFLNLLELVKNDQANLIATFDWNSIEHNKIKLPKLKIGVDYILQGVIYYCEDKKNSLCYIKSYEQQIIANQESKSKEIEMKLGFDAS